MNLHRMGQKMPNYPGREALERVLGPLVAPVARRGSGFVVQRLLGFWVMQAAYGGDLSGLVEHGIFSRAGAYKQAQEFRDLFGCDATDFLPDLAEALYESGLAVKVGYPEAVAPRTVTA